MGFVPGRVTPHKLPLCNLHWIAADFSPQADCSGIQRRPLAVLRTPEQSSVIIRVGTDAARDERDTDNQLMDAQPPGCKHSAGPASRPQAFQYTSQRSIWAEDEYETTDVR